MPTSTLDDYYTSTYGSGGTNTLSHFYTCNEASGTIIDLVGSLDGTGSGLTYGQTSILPTTDGETCIKVSVASGAGANFSSNWGGFPKTFECWVQYTTLSISQINFMFGNGGFNNGVYFGFFFPLSWLGLFNNGASSVAHATWSPVINTTYHLACTCDGTSAGTIIYINGVAQTMTAVTTPSVASSTSSAILGSGYSNGMLGTGEKFAIYDGVLTPTQIMNNYVAGRDGISSGGGGGGGVVGYSRMSLSSMRLGF